MKLHEIAVFVHVVGALVLFGGQAIELVGFDRLRRSTSAESVQGVLGFMKPLGSMFRFSGVTLLVTGVYLTITAWGWHGWIVVSLALLVALAVSGPLLAKSQLGPIARAAAVSPGTSTVELMRLTGEPKLLISFYLRSGVALGIVFLMVAKPALLTSVIVIVVAAVVGYGAARLALGRTQTVAA